MDKARQKLEQFKNKYESSQQDNSQVTKSSDKTNSSDNNINDFKAEVDELRQQISEVTNKNKQLSDKNQSLIKKQQDYSKRVETQNNEKAMSDVITGFTGKFEKEYTFPVEGNDPINFKIVMRPMYALEISQIRNETIDLTASRYKYYDSDTAFLLESIVAIKNLADEAPEWLTDISHLARTDIPVIVYNDYLDWLATFRQSREY